MITICIQTNSVSIISFQWEFGSSRISILTFNLSFNADHSFFFGLFYSLLLEHEVKVVFFFFFWVNEVKVVFLFFGK